MRPAPQYIGQSRPRHGNKTAGSQFYFEEIGEGERGGITREYLTYKMTSLHASVLVEHEKAFYEFAAAHDLPVPELLEAHGLRLTTELVGPSARMLFENRNIPFPLKDDEAASLLVNLLRANRRLADQGVWPADGHLHNSLVWLEHGRHGGRLDFERVLMIDHTYTLWRGGDFRRPLWLGSTATHFPPEARPFKQADEQAFVAELNRRGIAGNVLGNIVQDMSRIADNHEQAAARRRLETAYRECQIPSKLQEALDRGILDSHRMVQFAVAACLLEAASRRGANLPESTRALIKQCRKPLEIMADPRPEARFDTLDAAAAAIADAWPGDLPAQSAQAWPTIEVSKLIFDVRGTTDPEPIAADRYPDLPDDLAGYSIPLGDEALAQIRRVVPKQSLTQIFRAVLKTKPLLYGMAAILVAAISSWKVPQTPDEYAQALRQAEIRQLVAKVGAGETAASASAVQKLKAIVRTAGHPDQAYTAKRIEQRFQEIERRVLGKSIVKTRDDQGNIKAMREHRRKAIPAVAPFAELDSPKAKDWMAVLQSSGLKQTVALAQ
jgi:hypothetical protein